MWITPKTNWKPEDIVDLAVDYARIENNQREIRALLTKLRGDPGMVPPDTVQPDGVTMVPFAQTTYNNVGLAGFYNAVEQNIDIFRAAGYDDPSIPPTLRWSENNFVWGAADLNRIEKSLATLYKNTVAALNARRTMAFTPVMKVGGTMAMQADNNLYIGGKYIG